MRHRIQYSKLSLLILVIHRLHFWMQLRLGLDLLKHWSCSGTIWIDHCYDLNNKIKDIELLNRTYFEQYNHVHNHNQIHMHTLQQYTLSQTFWNSGMLVHHGRSSYRGNSLTYLGNLLIDLYSAQKEWLMIKQKISKNQFLRKFSKHMQVRYLWLSTRNLRRDMN